MFKLDLFEQPCPGFRSEGFAASLIVTVGVVLRGWRVFSAALWYDEAFTALLARLPFPQMIQATRGDVHPPLYYALIGVLDGVYIRMFSVVCSVLALGLFWMILRRLDLTPAARLLALSLMAFAEPQLWYAGEARMYAWMELLVLGIWLAILTRRWWIMGALSTLLLYTHNYAPLYLAVLAMVALAGEMRRPRNFYVPPASGPQPDGYGKSGDVIQSLLAAGLIYLPWFVWAQIGQLTSLDHHWTQSTSGITQMSNLSSMVFGRYLSDGMTMLALMIMAGGSLLLVRWSLRNHRAGVLALSLGPVVLMVLISVIYRPVWLPRGMLAATPALYVLLAESITTAPAHRRLVLAGLLGPLFLASTLAHIGMVSIGQVKYASESWQIGAVIEPGVPVIHNSDYSLVTWAAMYGPANQYLIHSQCEPEPGSLSDATRAVMGLKIMPTLPAEYYLVGTLSGLSDACEEAELTSITATAEPVMVQIHDYGIDGVWHVR